MGGSLFSVGPDIKINEHQRNESSSKVVFTKTPLILANLILANFWCLLVSFFQ